MFASWRLLINDRLRSVGKRKEKNEVIFHIEKFTTSFLYTWFKFFIRKRHIKQYIIWFIIKPLFAYKSIKHESCRKEANNFKCLELHYTELNAWLHSSLAVLSSQLTSLFPQANIVSSNAARVSLRSLQNFLIFFTTIVSIVVWLKREVLKKYLS